MSDIKPCPFCGVFPGKIAGKAETYCGLEHDVVGPLKLKVWNSAYCWKELDSVKKELDEALRLLGTERDRFGKMECEMARKVNAYREVAKKLSWVTKDYLQQNEVEFHQATYEDIDAEAAKLLAQEPRGEKKDE